MNTYAALALGVASAFATQAFAFVPLPIDSCVPNTCTFNQCGVISDGCRSEMWCGDCGCGATERVCERTITPIFDQPLAAGPFEIATSALSEGADPVIHVLNSAGQEVAFDDNSGEDGNALATGTLSGPGRVIIRAKSEFARGTAIATINGSPQPITLGGTFQTTTGMLNDRIESVKLFGSRTDEHVLYILAADGLHLSTRVLGGGTSGAVFWASPIGAATLVFGTLGTTAQPARIIRNDPWPINDSDNDGLGNGLEAALGTCAHATAFTTGRDGIEYDCSLANDPRDTDGDGLSDAVEVFGSRSAATHQPLPLWGSDPRHKDLFVEIDASQLVPGGGTPKLTPAEARRFSDYYGDRTRTLDPFTALHHAITLNNPDKKPGIRTHVDIGVAPLPGDEHLYGDWGGWSVVPPAPAGGGQDPRAAVQTFMDASRMGLFRYAFWYVGGGGQNPTSPSTSCVGCGVYAWSSGNEIDTFTHESIHTNGLAHSGPAKLDGVDPNCKAAYPSIVNYAYQGAGVGLSDGLGFEGVNNARATEWAVIPPANQTTLNALRTVFGYRVDLVNGHVDWNRDGVFAPEGTTVRAYTNYVYSTGCEYTKYNSEHLSTSLNTRVTPALGRDGNTLFLFSGGESPLRYVTAPSPFDCTATNGTPCAIWSSVQTMAVDSTLGVDAARVSSGLLLVTVGADGRLWYVNRYNRAGFRTWSTPQLVPNADLASGEPSLMSLPDGSALLLYRRTSGELVEAQFTVPNNKTFGSWARIGLARQTSGATITQSPQAAPGMVHAAFTGIGPTTYGLFAEAPDAILRLWQYVPATQRWQTSSIPVDNSIIWWRSVSGRPAAVWVPSTDNAQGGRLYVISTSRDGHETDPLLRGTGRGIIMRYSYAAPSTGALRLGMIAGYGSDWDYSFGVDAWFDPGIDDNVRVAWAISPYTNPAFDSRLKFNPKGDGINDFFQRNYNDWPYVGFALCKSLVAPSESGPNPINCGTRPPVLD